MKLPRLQFNYVVFYSYYLEGFPVMLFGFSSVYRIKRISNVAQIKDLNEHIKNLQKEPMIGVVITNYKLLSVRIVWR